MPPARPPKTLTRSSRGTPRGGAKVATRKARGAPVPPPARTRLEVDERREQLVRLGIELFSERAYDDVSIDAFAAAAGISKGLLYHYFPTKRDFYVATLRAAAAELLAATDAVGHDFPPIERAAAGLDAFLAYVERRGPAYAGLLRGGIGADPEVTRIVTQVRDTFCDRLLLDAAAGMRTPAVRTALRGWVGFVEAATLDWVDHKDLGRAEMKDLLVRSLFALFGSAG